jgi:hypothetical protein
MTITSFLVILAIRRRAEIVYLPLGLLGFIVMSYLGIVAERSKRSRLLA